MDEAVNNSTTRPELQDLIHDNAWLITLRFVVVGFGIVLNSVVTGVFMYTRMYRKSLLHGLIVQQSFVDFFGCCFFLIFYNQDAPSGNWGRAFCRSRSLFWFASSTSTYNLLIITIERFIAVVHPITYRKKSIGKRSRLFYIIPYIIGFLISFHLAIIADLNDDLIGECVYNANRGFSLFSGLVIFTGLFFLPACFMSYCYGRILMVFRKRAKARQENAARGPGGTDKPPNKRSYHVSTQRNLVYTMLFVVIGFIFTTAPNFTMYLVYNICRCFEFSTILAHEITVLIYACNMCINPIIYGAKMNEFRSGVLNIWRRTIKFLTGADIADESTCVDNSLSQSNNDTLNIENNDKE
ncbi:trace amine-associated receptor 3-like [Anneissia japonica]|uniref:trace amine-associated receptor 3-like n=1 Tax=Anneissia japonica TaxID=1529436 RepID=UPI001425A4B6|nr:trace amine-associated receptor 3-like [Anneissia japonica]